MKSKFWLAGLAAVAVLSLSCSKKGASSSGGGSTITYSSTPNISVLDSRFSPQNDSVAVGTTITWTYSASLTHTVTSDQAGLFNSGDMPTNGPTFTHTFNSPGIFTYHCIYHQAMGMTGRIKVQ
ncbi:MAG: plastocyanin/azurin family copper-binding protein [candidate division Zixibacteria bacterium]|nr:plastocyanin/azurin family copper-binding protein [candidate division Zixibacteria bacterium]